MNAPTFYYADLGAPAAGDDGADSEATREAIEATLTRATPRVRSWFLVRLYDKSNADDLVQEVLFRFVRYCRRSGEVPHEAHAIAWLVGCARNVLREHLRRGRTRREVLHAELASAADHRTGSPADAERTWEEERTWLPEAIAELSATSKEALRLKYTENCSVDEIASRLGRTSGAVKLILFRARQSIRAYLDRQRAAVHFRERMV